MPDLPAGQLAASGIKPALHGCFERKGIKQIPTGYRASLGGYVIGGSGYVTWNELQTKAGAALTANNVIDQAITEMQTWNAANPGNQQGLKVRIAAGINSPAWTMTSAYGGSFAALDPNSGIGGPCPYFWTKAYSDAFYAFEALLVAKYDTVPEILEVVLGKNQTVFTEPYIRQLTNSTQCAAMIADGYLANAKGDTGVTAGTDQYQQLADIAARAVWKHTKVGFAFFPYQIVRTGGNGTDVGFTTLSIDYAVNGVNHAGQPAFAGLKQQFSAENNSARDSYIGGGGDMGTMYAAMNAAGTTNGIQTAQIGQFSNNGGSGMTGSLGKTITWCGTNINAGHVELPSGFDKALSSSDVATLGAALPTQAGVSGNPTVLQHVPFGSAAIGTTFTVPNLATQAGSTLVLHIFTRGASASSITSISGATWTNRTSLAANAIAPFGLHATYDNVNAAAKAANAFLITVSPTGSIEGEFFELAGALTYEGSHAVAGGGTAASVAYTTTNATDLVIGSIGWDSGSQTLGSLQGAPWSNDTPAVGVAAGEGSTLQAGYVGTVATGVQTYSGTLSATSPWVGAITAYTSSGGAVAPSIPSGVNAHGAAASAVIDWTPPFNGGSVITDYLVQQSLTGTGGWSTATRTPASPSAVHPVTVTGLTNGTLYYFQVAAVNVKGTGGFSAIVSATPAATPAAPQPPTWPVNPPNTGPGEVNWVWIPGDPGTQPVDEFEVTETVVGGAALTPVVINDGPPPTAGYDDTSLVNFVAYTATVRTHSSVGWSAMSAASQPAMPSTAPMQSTVTTVYPPTAHPAISAKYAALLLSGKGS
jgi:hypothetical protein